MRVVVVGGGVTGLTLAAMLRRTNVQCIVIEQAPDIESQFQLPVVLWANALTCFRAFGLDHFMNGVDSELFYGIRQAGSNRWLLRTPNIDVRLNPMDEHDAIPTSTAATATSQTLISKLVTEQHKLELADVPMRLTIPAAQLKHSLRAHVQDMRFGRRVVGIRPSAGSNGGAHVVLDNGHVEWGDVVVGADGLDSTIRHLVYPHQREAHQRVAQDMTQIDGYVTVPEYPEVLGDEPCELWGDRRVLSYLPTTGYPDKERRVVAFSGTLYDPPKELVAGEAEADIDPEAYKHLLAREFESFGPDVARLVGNAEFVRKSQLLQVPVMPQWHNLRAVLAGDAAHGTFPSYLQQDASLCIEDAAILATALAEIPLNRDSGFRYAFARYEGTRRQRIEEYTRQSLAVRKFAAWKQTQVRDAAVSVVPGFAVGMGQRWLNSWSYSGKSLVYDPYGPEN